MSSRNRTHLILIGIYLAIVIAGILYYRVQQNGEPVAEEKPIAKSVKRNLSHGYLGAEACSECHKERFESFSLTTHHSTSRLASETTVMGSFDANDTSLKTRNPRLSFKMSKEDGNLYQSAMVLESNNQETISWKERFDLAIGSGKLGQTYLFWWGDALFQLPVSYISYGDQWINSPGYRDGLARFDRAVRPGCLQCHVTFVESAPQAINVFFKDTMINGISCERCHGPGQRHVQFHRSNPDVKEPNFIIHPRRLSRDRRNDLCAQCHGGTFDWKRPVFSYRPGDDLSEFITPTTSGPKTVGLHSNNQLQRLKMSKCFQKSDMTCIDCHNPHKRERGQLKLFSQRCLKCHEVADCTVPPKTDVSLSDDCISCHMPQHKNRSMKFDTTAGDKLQLVDMRDHRIAVYRD